MKGFVTTVPPEPLEPEQTITLDLSVEEFAMLQALVYSHLGGSSALRKRISSGFAAVTRDLTFENRQRVQRATEAGSPHRDGWNSENVAAVFA